MPETIDLKPGGVYADLDLSGHDFAEADLSDAKFVDCTIVDAQLSAVMFQGASFTSCKITRCRLAHADLREARFVRCNFGDPDSHSGVEIAFSQLDQASFQACDLSFADISRSSAWSVTFEDCNLRGARFHRADFTRVLSPKTSHTAAAFRRCNLELADLSDADLKTCDLSGSSLREADLTEADLTAADLTRCDLFQALTFGAKLGGADLRGAEVSGLNLAELGAYDGMKVTFGQQQALLSALGLDLYAD